jgi:ABC-type uncharacterized transport system ATPase subunit
VPAGLLAYAEQRTLEIGVTIAGGADVILLDEPTAGMSRAETERAVALIRRLTEARTLLIVEHDMSVVFGLADRISVAGVRSDHRFRAARGDPRQSEGQGSLSRRGGSVMLEVQDLHAYYGKSHILQGVDMYVDAGEVVSLLGRNGVGRSTTVKAIMGEVPPQGLINFNGHNIARTAELSDRAFGAWLRSRKPGYLSGSDSAAKSDAWHQGSQAAGKMAPGGHAADVCKPRGAR